MPDDYRSVIICPITSTLADLGFRIDIEPSSENGLRLPSQIMTDKIIAVPRAKIGKRIGSLDAKDMHRLNGALVFLLALVETEGF